MSEPLRATTPWVDNVARWRDEVLPAYPGASFSYQGGQFRGTLRDDDEPLRHTDLGRLIDALLARG